jgi:hypothetical protein
MHRTHYAGNPGVQVGLVLEEVQVAPGLGLTVMDRAIFAIFGVILMDFGAGEVRAAGKVQVEIQPSLPGVEGGISNLPRLG